MPMVWQAAYIFTGWWFSRQMEEKAVILNRSMHVIK